MCHYIYYHKHQEEIWHNVRLQIIIHFSSLFVYPPSSTASGQLQSQHEYKTAAAIKQAQGQSKQIKITKSFFSYI
jgi:hypothetical protein